MASLACVTRNCRKHVIKKRGKSNFNGFQQFFSSVSFCTHCFFWTTTKNCIKHGQNTGGWSPQFLQSPNSSYFFYTQASQVPACSQIASHEVIQCPGHKLCSYNSWQSGTKNHRIQELYNLGHYFTYQYLTCLFICLFILWYSWMNEVNNCQ